MRYYLSVFALLIASCSVFAAPPKLVIAPQVKPVDGYVCVQPDTDAVKVIYISIDGLTSFPSALLKDDKILIVPTKGEKPGSYRYIAVGSSKEGDLVRVDFSVVIDGPPTPPDPFIAAVTDAYSKETGVDKAKQVATLASLYKTALTTTLNDPTVKTVGDLFQDLKVASGTLLPADAIPLVRKVIGDRLGKSLGTSATTPIDKKLITDEFQAIVSALGGLK